MERHPVIVLARGLFSKTSLSLAVWSRRSGWMDVTAKGMLRPRNNRLGDMPDEFDVSEMTLYRRPDSLYPILVEHNLEAPAPALRSDWLKYAAFSSMRDVLSAVWKGYPADEDDAWKIYGILAGLQASAPRVNGLILCVAGIMRILAVTGVAPLLDGCASCGADSSPGGWAVSWLDGGLVCTACLRRNGRQREALIDRGLVEVLIRAAGIPADNLAPLKPPSLDRSIRLLAVLRRWCESALDISPVSLPRLAAALQGAAP
ncbi:MAG TPA: hypothetical protein ENN09_05935 [Planctomycetes bacterium]|nr:hypothetical protein [Planctomycetota bacterium]